MLNLALNFWLIIAGIFFVTMSVWGKRFYEMSWRKPLWGRAASAVWGAVLLIWGALSLYRR
jgi:hypothetical protein